MNEKVIETSVLIPVYNEERNIEKLLQTINAQAYAKELLEVIFIDGGSTDGTLEKIVLCQSQTDLEIRILNNPYRTAQHAMNIGIDNARGQFIIRLDAHSFYPKHYIKVLIDELKQNDKIGNVGGVWSVSGEGSVGKAYANVLSTMFGVGNSRFRISSTEEYVNTVPFGAFRKSIFNEVGKYDERLERNEDYELNLRIIRHGYKILLKPNLIIEYKCRNTVGAIWKHEISDGIWNTLSLMVAPYTFSIAHFIPLAFVLSLILMPIIFMLPCSLLHLACWAELLLYGSLDIIFSFYYAKSDKKIFFLSLILYPIHHIGCGLGSLLGVLCRYKLKSKN